MRQRSHPENGKRPQQHPLWPTSTCWGINEVGSGSFERRINDVGSGSIERRINEVGSGSQKHTTCEEPHLKDAKVHFKYVTEFMNGGALRASNMSFNTSLSTILHHNTVRVVGTLTSIFGRSAARHDCAMWAIHKLYNARKVGSRIFNY